MYFTQEDFQKIEKYFKERSYKDTDFKYLDPDKILDTDMVAIVHMGTNKRITILNLTDKISSVVNKVDDHLSDKSVNPVLNKVIHNALEYKEDKLDYMTQRDVNALWGDIFG